MSLDARNFIKSIFDIFFWRQHPEAALRYLPVVSAIKQAKLADPKIVEVGSGSLGITPYLKRNIDGLDIDFSGPKSSFLRQIKGSAEKIPFHRNSYDVAISVDTIEHLPKDIRERAVFELLRVSQKMAIIVVPVGKYSEDQDKRLYNHWQKVFGTKNQFLEEHLINGLPTSHEILVWIDKSLRKLNKKAKVKSNPSLNLFIREILMRIWISKNKLFYYGYLKGILLFLPLLRLANFGNCYRRVFVIEFVSPAENRSSSRRSSPLRA